MSIFYSTAQRVFHGRWHTVSAYCIFTIQRSESHTRSTSIMASYLKTECTDGFQCNGIYIIRYN